MCFGNRSSKTGKICVFCRPCLLDLRIQELALCSQRSDVFMSDLDDDLDKLVKFLRSIQIRSPLCSLTDSELQSLTTDEQLLLHLFYDKELEFIMSLVNKARSLRNKETDMLKSVATVSFTH
jgi:hypothetical protein